MEIFGFGPPSGQPTQKIRVSGRGLHHVIAVQFAPGIDASFTASADGTLLTVSVPLDAVTGPITLIAPNSRVSSKASFVVQPAAPPVILSVGPPSVEPGWSVYIRGANLLVATSVKLNDLALLFTPHIEPGSLLAIIPAGARDGPITVTTPFGEATSKETITVIQPGPPIISGLVPASGPPESFIEINGRDLRFATSVQLNGVEMMFFGSGINPGKAISAQVPTNATSGFVTVITPYGRATSTQTFVVTPRPAPVIDYVQFQFNEAWNRLKIWGRHLRGATAVLFNDIAAEFSVITDQWIDATIPPNFTNGKVTVVSVAGSHTMPFSVPARPVPRIDDFNPKTGSAGDRITITGVHLSLVREILFNGVPALFWDVGWIGAAVPTNATSGPITVRTAYGEATSEFPFTVRTESDLALSIEPGVEYFRADQSATLAILALNPSVFVATNVQVRTRLDPKVSVTAVQTSLGSCGIEGGVVKCELGNLQPQQSAKIALTIKTETAGLLPYSSEISFQGVDLDQTDNRIAGRLWAIGPANLPPVRIETVDRSRMRVSWGAEYPNVKLQAADALWPAPDWRSLDIVTTRSNDRLEVIFELGSSARFFRLTGP